MTNKYCIASAYSHNFEEIVNITKPTLEKYANLHNIDIVIENIQKYDRPFSWYKVYLILNLLQSNKYDYVLWIDSDAVILSNKYQLDAFIVDNKYLYLAKDINGINCGVMMVKNNHYMINFLNKVYSMTEYLHDGWWEQKAIHKLVNDNYENITTYIEYIPQHIWNAYDYGSCRLSFDGNVSKDSFIFHTPGMSINQKIHKLKQYIC